MKTQPAQFVHPEANETAEVIFDFFHRRGENAYIGEAVSQIEHALQAAFAAKLAGAGSELITAALLHDIGHLLHDLPEDCADAGIDDAHEDLGALWLQERFPASVVEPVRMHVEAKRYLCATDSAYLDALSPASKQSLALQGGIFSSEEAARFIALDFAPQAVELRRWDDIAKVPGMATPDLEHYRAHIMAALKS